ncbi:MAG: ABC transporter substrate-binding protein [Candidatus Jorgensenbacteria bacterium]|nr:ABC transporter substrate-binding protein [Candidatus Jorgensenbacteria bacterium]
MKLIRSIIEAWSISERQSALVTVAVCAGSAVALLAVSVAAHSTFVPVSGGVYREGIVGQPSIVNPLASANPTDQDLSALLFAPLKTFLASVERSKDATVYTLKLKENLLWDDGTALTSDDIVFTVGVAQEPGAESAFATALRGVSVERVSALQIKLTLPSPNVLFENTLARLPIIPTHIWGRIPVKNYHLSEYALQPVGNGPYRVEAFSKSKDGFIDEYHLVPNERYHGAAPYITDFYVRFFESADALLDAFRLRKINGFGFLPPFPEAYEVFEGATTARISLPRYYAIFVNASANDILADPNFRLALSRAVNRGRLAREVFQGDAESYFPGMTAEDARNIFYTESATSALAKAKYGTDATFTLTVPDIPFLVKAAEMIVADWQAAGIPPVTIQKVPLVRFRDDVLAPRAYELVLAPHVLTDPQDLYPLWHSAARSASGENFSLYANSKVDSLLERIRDTGDTVARGALVKEVVTALVKDLPAVFLVSLPYTHVHTKDLEGFPSAPLITPADRFLNVSEWNVARARILE